HVKVILTGEGADEVFLGYISFQPGKGMHFDQILNKLKEKKAPKRLQAGPIVEALGFVPLPDYVDTLSPRVQIFLLRFFARKNRPRHLARHPLQQLKERIDRHQTEGRPLVRKMQYAWIKNILAPYILTILGDRAELGHSVEGRTPFLDHHLFEAVRHVPDRFKIHDGVEKYVLREAFKDRVTEAIYIRKKWPFSAPPLWIEKGRYSGLDELLKKYLSREAVLKSGIFSYQRIRVWQWLTKRFSYDSLFRRKINTVLLLILTVQILDHLFIQDFEGNLKRTAPPTATAP
ncbi:MAG TPA: asparagine synthase-related protein, partial [Syntrophales bacterium]|nr:asparagine synthase-related protein [Syntrophales bacterium]